MSKYRVRFIMEDLEEEIEAKNDEVAWQKAREWKERIRAKDFFIKASDTQFYNKQKAKKEDPILVILKAKKNGFYTNTGDFWFRDDFVIDYTLEHGYILRSITKRGTLGTTMFKLSDYKVTWFLKEDRSE